MLRCIKDEQLFLSLPLQLLILSRTCQDQDGQQNLLDFFHVLLLPLGRIGFDLVPSFIYFPDAP